MIRNVLRYIIEYMQIKKKVCEFKKFKLDSGREVYSVYHLIYINSILIYGSGPKHI